MLHISAVFFQVVSSITSAHTITLQAPPPAPPIRWYILRSVRPFSLIIYYHEILLISTSLTSKLVGYLKTNQTRNFWIVQ